VRFVCNLIANDVVGISQGKALMGVDLHSYAVDGEQKGGFSTAQEGKSTVGI
jgi:hypothetical protein